MSNHNPQIFSKDLKDEDNWVYSVQAYTAGHSQLQFILASENVYNIFYLNFVGVLFYDGPFLWSGRGFMEGDRLECLQILKSIKSFRYKDEDALLNDYNLFVAEPEQSYRIRIIAGGYPTLTEENLMPYHTPSI